MSWYDAVAFCQKLSEMSDEKAAGYVYMLPTETQWEYACRAGTTTMFSFGDSVSELDNYAWLKYDRYYKTHPVGGKKPNAWALYDMYGNVLEWCHDRYGDYPSGSLTDSSAPAQGSLRDWDQHGALVSNIPKQCRDIDQPQAALITDLKQRGMLDDTLIIWGGEFGRTVYGQGGLKDDYGRDHHGRSYSMWLAGGGF
jgi:hypothetical protein